MQNVRNFFAYWLIFLSTLFNQMLLSLKIYNNGNKEEQKVIINKNKIVNPCVGRRKLSILIIHQRCYYCIYAIHYNGLLFDWFRNAEKQKLFLSTTTLFLPIYFSLQHSIPFDFRLINWRHLSLSKLKINKKLIEEVKV